MANYEKFVDRLFDESNDDTVCVKDNDGNEIEFEQVAVVDFEESYYAILKPVKKLEGIEEDECLVFKIDEENDCLVYEEDERVIDGVSAEFEAMVEELDEE